MKKYTDKEIERLKRKYMTKFELSQQSLYGTLSMFHTFYFDTIFNFALLIRAAEDEL